MTSFQVLRIVFSGLHTLCFIVIATKKGFAGLVFFFFVWQRQSFLKTILRDAALHATKSLTFWHDICENKGRKQLHVEPISLILNQTILWILGTVYVALIFKDLFLHDVSHVLSRLTSIMTWHYRRKAASILIFFVTVEWEIGVVTLKARPLMIWWGLEEKSETNLFFPYKCPS